MLIRKIKVFLITLLMCIAVFPLHVYAYGDIDTDSKTSLTISFQDDHTGIQGAAFNIYQVATVDSRANYTFISPYDTYGYTMKNLNTDGWLTLARNLDDRIIENNIAPTAAGVTDANGNITFDQLDTGMYLVVGISYSTETMTYTFTPYLIALPDYEDSQWKYDITSSVKYGKEPVEQSTDKTVLKVWNDAGYESKRPSSITVQLYNKNTSEKVGDPVELSESNDWTYTWKDLDGTSDDYTVIEVSGNDSYTPSKEVVDGVDKITNTYKNPGETPTPSPSSSTTPSNPSTTSTPAASSPATDAELPFTGIIWWPIPVIACIGLGFYVIGWKQKKDHE